MGGVPKGRLPAPETGEPLVVAAARLVRELALELVLVGDAVAYVDLLPGIAAVSDAPPGIGPLGGLAALLEHAALRGATYAVSLACDLPHLAQPSARDALARLAIASAPVSAAVVAPRRHAHAPWEPLFARYDVALSRPVVAHAIGRGVRSFQRLFDDLEVHRFELSTGEISVLDDWDTPDDVARAHRSS